MNNTDKNSPPPLSVRKNMLFNSIGSLAYQGGLWLITVLVVTLSNGFDDSGILAFAMTIGNMFNPIATFSMRIFQASDVKKTYESQTYVGFRCVTILLATCIMIPYALTVTPSTDAVPIMLAFLLFKADEAFCDVLYGIDQSAQRMDYVGISQFLRSLLVVSLFVGSMLLFHNLFIAVVGMACAGLIVTLTFDMPHASRISRIRPQITREQVLTIAKTCLPLVISTLFMGMLVSIPRQCFTWLYGLDSLGRYAAIATPAVLVQALVGYLYAPVLVPLAERHAEGRSSFLDAFLKTLRLLALSIAGVVLLLSLLGRPLLLAVYGPEIEPYVGLFPMVLVSTGLISLLWYVIDVLVVTRDLKAPLIATSVMLAVCLVAMVPLERVFVMDGINYTIIVAAVAGLVVASSRLALHIRSMDDQPSKHQQEG